MDRPRRFRIAAFTGLGLFAMFVACVGAPLLAALFVQKPNSGGDIDSMISSFSQFAQTAAFVNRISFGSFLAGIVCFACVFVDVAVWFVGPPEKTPESLP